MGKYSSDSDNDKRARKHKGSKSRRSSSPDSEDRYRRRKDKKSHGQRSRSRDRYSKSRRSRSGSSHRSSSYKPKHRRSASRDRSRRDRRRRSTSKDRYRSRRSRSKSYIKEYVSKAKRRSSSCDSSSGDSAKLSTKSVAKNIDKLELPANKNIVKKEDDVVIIDSTVLEEINEEGFSQKKFASGNKKIPDNIVIDLRKQTIKVPEVEQTEPDTIFSHNLFLNEEARLEKWVKELYSFRQKALQQGLK